MKRTREGGAEFIQLEARYAGALRAAEKRITPIILLWASTPNLTGLDIFWLAVSCYMQGTIDGYGVAERQKEQGR